MFSEIANFGTIPVLEKTLAFVEARNKMLAENIANITTPGYRARQLDVGAFQAALREAVARRAPGEELVLKAGDEFSVGRGGLLSVTPSEEPAENLLFHDGTNARIERQMAQLAENTMMNRAAAELLKKALDGLQKAIRGRAI